jgi:hypothetical protein
MRLTVILGLDHVEPTDQQIEATRILSELAGKIVTQGDIKVGDSFILRDINGNRIGVADVFAN